MLNVLVLTIVNSSNETVKINCVIPCNAKWSKTVVLGSCTLNVLLIAYTNFSDLSNYTDSQLVDTVKNKYITLNNNEIETMRYQSPVSVSYSSVSDLISTVAVVGSSYFSINWMLITFIYQSFIYVIRSFVGVCILSNHFNFNRNNKTFVLG